MRATCEPITSLDTREPFDLSFWQTVPFEPVRSLDQLRNFILGRNAKRSPKWRFRLASDLVLELQPKPGGRGSPLFDGRAVMGDDITPAAFQPGFEGRNTYRLRLNIIDAGDRWALRPRAIRRPSGATMVATFGMKERLVAELGGGRFEAFDAGLMLQPACMVCGRPLTDPASMARWIGPECFGSGTLTVPRTYEPDGSFAEPVLEPVQRPASPQEQAEREQMAAEDAHLEQLVAKRNRERKAAEFEKLHSFIAANSVEVRDKIGAFLAENAGATWEDVGRHLAPWLKARQDTAKPVVEQVEPDLFSGGVA